MTDTLREKVAEALLSIEDSWNDHTWDQLPDGTKAMFLTQADAAIAAVMEALQTPTEAMKLAGAGVWLGGKVHGMDLEWNSRMEQTWQAMLTAYIEGSAK